MSLVDLGELAVQTDQVAVVWLLHPFRPPMSFARHMDPRASHGWRVAVTLNEGTMVTLRSWSYLPVGATDDADEPDARAFYAAVLAALGSGATQEEDDHDDQQDDYQDAGESHDRRVPGG